MWAEGTWQIPSTHRFRLNEDIMAHKEETLFPHPHSPQHFASGINQDWFFFFFCLPSFWCHHFFFFPLRQQIVLLWINPTPPLSFSYLCLSVCFTETPAPPFCFPSHEPCGLLRVRGNTADKTAIISFDDDSPQPNIGKTQIIPSEIHWRYWEDLEAQPPG